MYYLVCFIVRSDKSSCGCVVASHNQTRAKTVTNDSRTVKIEYTSLHCYNRAMLSYLSS